jgi:hypothetical protein
LATEILGALLRLAASHHVAQLMVRRGLGKELRADLEVEPYALAHGAPGADDVLVLCYESWPDDGWRILMSHRILGVTDTGRPFRARRTARPVVVGRPAGGEAWSAACLSYREILAEALVSGGLTEEQREEALPIIERDGITEAVERAVRDQVHDRCLCLLGGLAGEDARRALEAALDSAWLGPCAGAGN